MDISKGQKHVNILGIRVDSTSIPSVLRKIAVDIRKGNKFYIVTPNPEHILKAVNDDEFREIINSSDISIPDGVGLVAANKFLELPNPKERKLRFFTLFLQGLGVGFSIIFDRKWLERDLRVIHGRNLFMDFVKLANKNKWKVYLLGGENNEAIGTRKILERSYLNIKFQARSGPILFDSGNPKGAKEEKEEKLTLDDINQFSPQLLFVGLGAPKQEKWLYRHFRNLKIGGAMMHGGTFRYISGQDKLPPKFVDELGLER